MKNGKILKGTSCAEFEGILLALEKNKKTGGISGIACKNVTNIQTT